MKSPMYSFMYVRSTRRSNSSMARPPYITWTQSTGLTPAQGTEHTASTSPQGQPRLKARSIPLLPVHRVDPGSRHGAYRFYQSTGSTPPHGTEHTASTSLQGQPRLKTRSIPLLPVHRVNPGSRQGAHHFYQSTRSTPAQGTEHTPSTSL